MENKIKIFNETIFTCQTRQDRIVAFKTPPIIVAEKYPTIILPPDPKKEKKNHCQRCRSPLSDIHLIELLHELYYYSTKSIHHLLLYGIDLY